MKREVIFCTCCHSVIEQGDTLYLQETYAHDGGLVCICKSCITPLVLDQRLTDEFWKENPDDFEDDYDDYLVDKEETSNGIL